MNIIFIIGLKCLLDIELLAVHLLQPSIFRSSHLPMIAV